MTILQLSQVGFELCPLMLQSQALTLSYNTLEGKIIFVSFYSNKNAFYHKLIYNLYFLGLNDLFVIATPPFPNQS
jgi:hypothetical protein